MDRGLVFYKLRAISELTGADVDITPINDVLIRVRFFGSGHGHLYVLDTTKVKPGTFRCIYNDICGKQDGAMPGIENVIFNCPATVVLWEDGTKTVVKCGDYDVFDPEKGLAMAIAKKALGNQGNYYEIFKKWLPKEEVEEPSTLQEALDRLKESIGKFGEHGVPYINTSTTKAASVCTIREYCVKHDCTKNKVYGMIKRGELKAEKDETGKWLIYEEE